MSEKSLHERYVAVLLDQLKDVKYPSPPMLDRIEGAITDRDTAREYVSTLLDLVEAERYPSPTLLDRINVLAQKCDR